MIKRILFVAVIILVMLYLVGFVNQKTRVYESVTYIEESEFSITFPNTPEVSTDISEAGPVYIYYASTHDNDFTVFRTIYEGGFKNETEEDDALNDMEGLIDYLNRDIPEGRELSHIGGYFIEFNSREARVDSFANEGGVVRTMTFIDDGDTRYMIMYAGNNQSFSESEWDSFIKSFKDLQS